MEKLILKRLLLVGIVFLFLAWLATAQSVSPVTVEYHGRVAKGEFTVVNDGLSPLDVAIEPMSFTLDDKGQPHFTALDTTHIHLKLDAFTAHLGIKQQRVFYYEIRCDIKPCWLSIYSRITSGKKLRGVNFAIHLPHTVYFCEQEKACREHVRRDVWGLK